MGFEETMLKFTSTNGFDVKCYDCGLVEIGFGNKLLQIPKEQFDELVKKRALLMM